MAEDLYRIESRVVLFTDVHDFSIAMRDLGDGSHLFIQAMYETIGESVVTHRGQIIKYIGDALLALFPTNAALDAVDAGLSMRTGFAELVKRHGVRASTELEVGISMGDVRIGVFGHPSLRSRDIVGEVVNEAAMIGHYRGVAITQPVRDSVASVRTVRELEPRALKWREEPLRIWAVEA